MVYPMQGYGYGGGYAAAQNTPQSFFANLQGKLQQGVIPSVQELVNTAPSFEPDSPQSQMFMAQAAQMLDAAGEFGDQRAQEFVIALALKDVRQINQTLLNDFLPQVGGANSPQGQQLLARVAAIQSVEQGLTIQQQRVMGFDPTGGAAVGVNSPINSPQAYLANLQASLAQGQVPSIQQLASSLPIMDGFDQNNIQNPLGLATGANPENQAFKAQVLGMLAQAGPEGQMRAQQLDAVFRKNMLEELSGTLIAISANLEPGSPEDEQLKLRMAAIDDYKRQFNAIAFQGTGNIPPVMNSLKVATQQQLNNIQGALFTINANMAPESPEAQQLQARIAQIREVQRQVETQMPTFSNNTRPITLASPPTGGIGSMMGNMTQMMQLMLETLMQKAS